MEIYEILFVLILIFAILIVFIQYLPPRIFRGAEIQKTQENTFGGGRCEPENASQTEQISLSDAMIVVDGNNFIHNLKHTIKIKKYEELLLKSFAILRENLPTANIHFVIKHDRMNWESVQRKLKDKKITIHAIKSSKRKTSKHYEKAADDILCLFIAQQFIQFREPSLNPPEIILLSNDLFRDIKDFVKTPAFNYKSINSGLIEEKTIQPSEIRLGIPINHIGVSFLTEEDAKKYNISRGGISLDTNYVQEKRKCMFMIFN